MKQQILILNKNYQSLHDFVCSLPQQFQQQQGELLFKKRNEVRRFNVDNLDIVVKKYKKPHFIQRIAYSFYRPSKAKRAYQFAEKFRTRGIDTPQEIAVLEIYKHGLLSTSYFVSLYTNGINTQKLLDSLSPEEEQTEIINKAIAQQMALMHSKGILHGDTNLSNFLLHPSSILLPPSFTMIDLNRSHFTPSWPSDEQCIRNLVRITHNRERYNSIVKHYANLRGWDEQATLKKALYLLHRFEHRIIK